MKILFCTGGSKKSESAILEGANIVKKLGADAVVLSVGPSLDIVSKMLGSEFRMSEVTIDTDKAVLRNTAKYADKGVKILQKAGVTAVAKTARGEVSDQILKEIATGDYDFVVLAAKGKPGDRHLLGSNTRKVLAKSKIPVYVI
ncbi:MAG: universal stress protein [Deltaproteobacteria bacterium]|nr:universal stress protein [Deltaproteobacteria bacterium]